MTSMAQSILGNHYIGKGALQKSDQPFDLMLCHKQDIAMFVTYEGKVIALDVDDLSYAIEERIRLSATDYVIASFIAPPDATLLCVTQNGKVIQRESKSIDIQIVHGEGTGADSSLAAGAGSPLYGRGGGSGWGSGRGAGCHGETQDPRGGSMTGAGSIEADGLILSIGRIPADSLRKVEG
jgi:hypothetical protein